VQAEAKALEQFKDGGLYVTLGSGTYLKATRGGTDTHTNLSHSRLEGKRAVSECASTAPMRRFPLQLLLLNTAALKSGALDHIHLLKQNRSLDRPQSSIAVHLLLPCNRQQQLSRRRLLSRRRRHEHLLHTALLLGVCGGGWLGGGALGASC